MSRASIKQEYEWVGGEDGHLVAKKSKKRVQFENIVGRVSIVGGLALGVTAATLEATGVWKVPPDHPHKNPPIERVGGHQGATHNTSPGIGTLHTKSGDFHVTQH